MVLAMWWLKKLKRESEEKQAEARREGRKEGYRAEREHWEPWAQHMEAEFRAAGLPFREPPPVEDE